ncbi:3-oxoacyl-ACP reductase FabG [Arhodomonas aquaeolei]|uniref:3-oxoacyl-ACP reductase FabG n=1 Tax=Arhodomonas TaxID=2368 RepID=UPI00216A417C|nr:3-oxoacyl-ACP reductase FabG [Arhodomonas aquaeolei]MCS4503326.1 3-oxoacyl-ACP reductase FabG [Arhodomonas aquaeolei]
MFSLENETALVTGASRGIGRAIATGLGQAGARVVGTATSGAGAERITAHLEEAGIEGFGVTLNVTDADSVSAAVAAVTEAYGAPTVLVNNAGITRDNLLMRMKDDEWDDIIDTDLSSVYRMSKAVLRGMMKARRGRIINIASVVGLMGNSGQTNYAAAKAGVMGMTRSLAREVGTRGITVNAVAPGFIETDMTDELNEAQREALVGQTPLARLGRAEDIAAAVCYLASPAAGFVTGETLNVNGGLYMA